MAEADEPGFVGCRCGSCLGVSFIGLVKGLLKGCVGRASLAGNEVGVGAGP